MLKWSLESRRRSVVLEEQQRDLEVVRRRLERCQERPNTRAWRKIRSVVTFCRLGRAGQVGWHREALLAQLRVHIGLSDIWRSFQHLCWPTSSGPPAFS